MLSVEITIERRWEDKFPIVIQEIEAGNIPSRQVGVLHFAEETRRELTAVAEIDPLKYGTIIGQAVFQDRVRDLFVAARARARAAGVPLRVWLVVEDPDLAPVRWKRLCAPLDGGWELLALRQDVPFSLYLASETDRRFPPISRRDLKSLLLVASPTAEDHLRLDPFDVPSTVASLRAAMEPDIPVDLLAVVEGADGPPTLESLIEWLTVNRCTMMHMVCHGALQGTETVLFLTGADGRVDTVTGSKLISRLRTLSRPPQFAFLSACESGSPDAEAALGGLAQRLVRDLGMQAVVAMTERVSIEVAGKLSTAFYRQLRDHGEPDRALVEATAGLDADRPDILVPVLYSRLGSRPLFDEAATRPLTASEIDFGLSRLCDLLTNRAPVLLRADRPPDEHTIGVNAAAALLRDTAPENLSTVSAEIRDRWTAALAEINSVSMESIDMSFASLASGKEPPPYDSRMPFRGLSPFLFEDRDFFFGRDQLVADLRKRLAAKPFLAVHGQSGSGKSSLVFAGLIPVLLTEDPALVWASFRPGESPIAALETALASLPESGGLLIGDQFEEIFTHTRDEAVRNDFFDRLLSETTKRRVVLTMRTEFQEDCAEHPTLDTAIRENRQRIPPMSAEELRHAMEAQISKVGFRFEGGLAATIIEEIRDEPGAMPLLQHALLELWNRRHGRWLKLSEYRALGGVKKAISATAEAVFQRLNPADQARVRDIFLRLARLDSRSAEQSTRRRVPLVHLVPQGEDPAVIRELVAELATARLVVVSEEPRQP